MMVSLDFGDQLDGIVVAYLQDCVKNHAQFKHELDYHQTLANLLGVLKFIMLQEDYEVWYDKTSSEFFWS